MATKRELEDAVRSLLNRAGPLAGPSPRPPFLGSAQGRDAFGPRVLPEFETDEQGVVPNRRFDVSDIVARNEESNRRLQEEEELRRLPVRELGVTEGTEAEPLARGLEFGGGQFFPAGELDPETLQNALALIPKARDREGHIANIRANLEASALESSKRPGERTIEIPTDEAIGATFDQELARLQGTVPTGEEGIVPTGGDARVPTGPIGQRGEIIRQEIEHADGREKVLEFLEVAEESGVTNRSEAIAMAEEAGLEPKRFLDPLKLDKTRVAAEKLLAPKVSTEASERALAEGVDPKDPAALQKFLQEDRGRIEAERAAATEAKRVKAIPENVKVKAAEMFPDKTSGQLTPQDILAVRKELAKPKKRTSAERRGFLKEARTELDRLIDDRVEDTSPEIRRQALRNLDALEKRGDVSFLIASQAGLAAALEGTPVDEFLARETPTVTPTPSAEEAIAASEAGTPITGTTPTFPPAEENTGRVVRDTETGQRFRSDGTRWVEI